MKVLLKATAYLLFILTLLGMIAWGSLAIYYSDIPWTFLRHGLSITFALASILGFLLVRPRRRAVLAFLVVFAALAAWWSSIPPSNHRNWQPDVAVLPYATTSGNSVTLHNIRNNHYRSENDYDVRHYDKTFDLDELESMDLFLVYWGSPAIAHTIMSFGFGDDEYVAVSIEIRKEQGEDYSPIKGFFRQYELIYVVADERDVVRLRPNYRGENVYLYRLRVPPETMRAVLLNYMKRINELTREPEWYNTLVVNCTTSIRDNVPYAVRNPWSWKLLLTGYLDELLYDTGLVDRTLPFAELEQLSRIDARSKAANDDPAYSARIREGLPGMDPM